MFVAALAVVFAWLVQTTLLPNLPLALVVVLAVAYVRGPSAGAVLGFCAGLLVDLAPPADGVAGMWATSFTLAGFLVGAVGAMRPEDGSNRTLVGVLGIASGTTLALATYSGIDALLGDPRVGWTTVASVAGTSVLTATILALVFVPLAGRLESPR